MPNSGRMAELLVAGAPVLLAPTPGGRRKTAYDLLLVRHRGRWVGVDARMPNPLFEEALRAGRLPEFSGCGEIRREVSWRGSRIDFSLAGAGERWLVETKSVNLVDGGTALFPDAPTSRGARHLEHLREACRQGVRAAVVFIVQRSDARRLAPHDRADPAFGAALRQAAAAGVRTLAYTCRVTPAAITVARSIPVTLDG